jgi:hypothetical protein
MDKSIETTGGLLNKDVGLFEKEFLRTKWQARRDSNSQHAVLETAALPIELLTFRENYRERTRTSQL